MNWYQSIDIYCERMDTTFWAEPINAISSLAFIIAAISIFKLYKKEEIVSYPFVFLVLLVLFIGIDSFLFHTFANLWSSLANTISIWVFVAFYVMFSIKIIFNNSWVKTAFIMLVIFVLTYLGFDLNLLNEIKEVPSNGSIQYAPALFFMVVFAVALYLKRANLSKYAFYVVGVFILSLIFRTIDITACNTVSLGTHFMWHILNGIMVYFLLYIILQAIVENKKLKI